MTTQPAYVNSFGCLCIKEPITMLKKYLAEHNIKSRTVMAGLGSTQVVALHCEAPSFIRKPYSIKNLNDFIRENELPYSVENTYPKNSQFKIRFI